MPPSPQGLAGEAEPQRRQDEEEGVGQCGLDTAPAAGRARGRQKGGAANRLA